MSLVWNRKTKTIIGVIVVLVAARIALPYVVLHYANKTLAENIPGYTGHIDDVDIALYRGAYRIDDLVIQKLEGTTPEPFVRIPGIDFSVEWKSIFNGAITGEVVVEQPEVVFGFGESPSQTQTGEEIDWVNLVTDLMPITINRFAIIDGKAKLLNAWADPKVDLEVEDIDFNLGNIRNVVETQEALPSPFSGNANFPGYGGNFHITGDAQLLKLIPDFNYDARLEGLDLVTANDLLQYYAGMDFERGEANVYSEMAMADGKFTGYVKPLLKDVQIFSRGEGDRTMGQYFKELFAEGAQELLENHRKDQMATRVKIEGDLDNPETDVWTAIIAVLRNAYFNAFRPQLDASIDYADALNSGEDGEKRGFFKRVFGGDEAVDDDDAHATSKAKAKDEQESKDAQDDRGPIKRLLGGKPDEQEKKE